MAAFAPSPVVDEADAHAGRLDDAPRRQGAYELRVVPISVHGDHRREPLELGEDRRGREVAEERYQPRPSRKRPSR